jgi:hypothetical protein
MLLVGKVKRLWMTVEVADLRAGEAVTGLKI